MLTDKQITAATQAVMEQLAESPVGVGIPLDTEVAARLGAFTEDAVTLADLMDDVLLTVGPDGSVFYAGD